MKILGMGEATERLRDWSRGDPDALARLIPLVVADLTRLAGHFFRGEKVGHTWQPTDLVNEIYLLLATGTPPLLQWETRAQFFGFAGRMMRNLLISHARHKKAARSGGKISRLSLTAAEGVAQLPALEPDVFLDLHRALEQFESIDPQGSRIVELRFFAGMTLHETASALGISVSEVGRDWQAAKRWLALYLEEESFEKALAGIN